ncbi:hypothetical protein C8J56DRAFT_499838 [Mycena floridula]|nr:hypothetical protein C8J56DRAFT_499838 [Mycena floridula]
MASGRNHYTKQDDLFLIQYLATYNPIQEGRKGNALYKTLSANAQNKWSWSARHSWQSWRDHYVKDQPYFDARIAHHLRQATNDQLQPVPAAKPAQPQEPSLPRSVQKSPPKPDLGEGSSATKQRVVSSQDYSNTIFTENHDNDEASEPEDAAPVNDVMTEPLLHDKVAKGIQQFNKYTTPNHNKYTAPPEPKLKRRRSHDSGFFESPSPRGSLGPGQSRPSPAPPVKLRPVPTYVEGPFGNGHRRKLPAKDSDTDEEDRPVKRWPPDRKGKEKQVAKHSGARRNAGESGSMVHQTKKRKTDDPFIVSQSHDSKPRFSSVSRSNAYSLSKSNNPSSSPLFTDTASSSPLFASRSETASYPELDFSSNSFVQGSSKPPRRYTIGGERARDDWIVPKLDLRVQLAKDRASKHGGRPSLPPELRRPISRSSMPIRDSSPIRSLTLSSSPSTLSNDDQQTIIALGLQAALSKMASERGFDFDVARRIFEETLSLHDTDEALKHLQIVAGEAADNYFEKKKRNRSAVHATLSSSPLGPSSPASQRQSSSPRRHSTPSSRAQSRKPAVFRPMPVDPDAMDVEYSPPAQSRAGHLVRLSQQGRTPEALDREKTRAARMLIDLRLVQGSKELKTPNSRFSRGAREDQLLREACESDMEDLRGLESMDKDTAIRKVYETVRMS